MKRARKCGMRMYDHTVETTVLYCIDWCMLRRIAMMNPTVTSFLVPT